MATLTKEQIRDFNDLKKQEVQVEAWGNGTIIVREPTSKERDDYEQGLLVAKRVGKSMEVTPNFTNAKAKLVVKCAINDDGTRMFKDSDAEWLGDKSANAIAQIVEVIERLGRMSQKDIDELTENFETDQIDDSSSV